MEPGRVCSKLKNNNFFLFEPPPLYMAIFVMVDNFAILNISLKAPSMPGRNKIMALRLHDYNYMAEKALLTQTAAHTKIELWHADMYMYESTYWLCVSSIVVNLHVLD